MIRKSIIKTKLSKSHDIPPYTQLSKTFRRSGSGGDHFYDPMFMNARVPSTSGPLRANPHQVCIIAFKPAGLVEVLKNHNDASTGTQLQIKGAGGDNIAIFKEFSTTEPHQFCSIRVPEIPGVYAPSISLRYRSGSGVVRSGDVLTPLVKNEFLPGYNGSHIEGYSPAPGYMSTGITQGPIYRIRMSHDISWPGVSYYCTGQIQRDQNRPLDVDEGANVTVVGAGRPHYFRWRSAGATVATARIPIIIEDDPTLDAFFATPGTNMFAASWQGGFIFSVYTGGAGPTGQRCEVLITDARFEFYSLMEFIPGDASAAGALVDTGTPFTTQAWQFVIDKFGIAWVLFAGMTSPYDDAIYTTFDPIGWDYPFLTYVPRSAINLGCVNTCVPVNTAY